MNTYAEYTSGFREGSSDFRASKQPAYQWATLEIKGKPVQKLIGPKGEILPGDPEVSQARGYVDGWTAARRRCGK